MNKLQYIKDFNPEVLSQQINVFINAEKNGMVVQSNSRDYFLEKKTTCLNNNLIEVLCKCNNLCVRLKHANQQGEAELFTYTCTAHCLNSYCANKSLRK